MYVSVVFIVIAVMFIMYFNAEMLYHLSQLGRLVNGIKNTTPTIRLSDLEKCNPRLREYQRRNGNQGTGTENVNVVHESEVPKAGKVNEKFTQKYKNLKTHLCHFEGTPTQKIYIEVIRRHPRSGYDDLGDGSELGLPDYYGWDYPDGGFDVVDA